MNPFIDSLIRFRISNNVLVVNPEQARAILAQQIPVSKGLGVNRVRGIINKSKHFCFPIFKSQRHFTTKEVGNIV